ncbi:MAG TPA: MBL fold metallo-hydrolase [Candidatus Rubrimentiphilum sp.]|nr:MBL fold metallo-hydrolase [Candidatus Rubrimentiphilum sp.]
MEHSVDIAHFDRLLQGANDAGVLLLDARNAPDSQRWRPEGPGMAAFANVPYSEFVEDEDAAMARVPDAASIYVLCARGQSSQYVTGVLRQRGKNAINIEGGMMAWSAHHRVVRLNADSDGFAIYQVVRPAKGCLSYIVRSDGQALVVDTTRYGEIYQEFAERNGFRVAAVADTHLHADHLSGGAALSSGAGAGYHLADEDAEGSALRRESMPKQFEIGATKVRVLTLPVPGHTLGSTALLVNDRYLISGDTLLPEGVGRPDLGNKAREWTQYLYDSLSGVLGKLDPHTVVLPAHAASAAQFDSRGACERRLGDLLATAAIADRDAFVEGVEQRVSQTSQPPAYAEIRKINLGEPASPERAQELEIGMNQCALSPAKA